VNGLYLLPPRGLQRLLVVLRTVLRRHRERRATAPFSVALELLHRSVSRPLDRFTLRASVSDAEAEERVAVRLDEQARVRHFLPSRKGIEPALCFEAADSTSFRLPLLGRESLLVRHHEEANSVSEGSASARTPDAERARRRACLRARRACRSRRCDSAECASASAPPPCSPRHPTTVPRRPASLLTSPIASPDATELPFL
jgi:hypothetical protein